MDQQDLYKISIVIGLFFVWMLWIGWKTHRARTHEESKENFLIGNRNVSAPLIAIGITMGWVDAFQFAFTPALTFDQGWFGLLYCLPAPISFVILGFFAGKIRDRAAQANAYMIGNYFAHEYSPRCGALVGVCMTLLMFTWLMMQLVFGGQVISSLTGIPQAYVVAGMGVVTLLYMLLGGFLASIRTDLVQFFIFLVFATLVVINITPAAPEWVTTAPRVPIDGMSAFSLMVVASIATFIPPDVWQRIYSASSAAEAKKSMFFTAALTLPMLLFFGALGLVVSHMNASPDSNNVISGIFQSVVPKSILPFALIAFMAAIMSTISTALFGGAINIASDIFLELKLITRDKIEKTARYLMVIILVLATILSQSSFDVLSLGMICMSAILPVFPLAVVMIFDIKISEKSAFYSLLFSVIVYFVGAYFNIYTGPYTLAPLVVAGLTLFIFEMARRKFGKISPRQL